MKVKGQISIRVFVLGSSGPSMISCRSSCTHVFMFGLHGQELASDNYKLPLFVPLNEINSS